MPARQSFQYDPLASQIDIGHGQAQVFEPITGMDDYTRSRQQVFREEQERYKREQDRLKKDTPPQVKTGKLAPALQKVATKDLKDFYNWWAENPGATPVEREQKQAELNDKLMGYQVTSKQYFDKISKYDPTKLSENEQQFRELDDYNAFDGYVDKEGNYTDDVILDSSNWARNFIQVKSVDLNKRFSSLRASANYNADINGYEIPDKDNPGQNKIVKTESVGEDLARDILEGDFVNMDAESRYNLQHQYNSLPQEEQDKYPTLRDYWARQENIDLLMRDKVEQRQKVLPKDRGAGDKEFDASLENIIRRIQNNDRSAMDLVIGSNYLGSTVDQIKTSASGIELTLANGDVHNIDVSTKAGAYNEFLNALRGVDAKRRQDIINVSKQEYAGDTDWDKMNKDISVIQNAGEETGILAGKVPKLAKKKLEDLGYTKVKWDDDKSIFTFKDPNGSEGSLNMSVRAVKEQYEEPSKITDDEAQDEIYQNIKDLLTKNNRESYIVEGSRQNKEDKPQELSGKIDPSTLKKGQTYIVDNKEYVWDGKNLNPK